MSSPLQIWWEVITPHHTCPLREAGPGTGHTSCGKNTAARRNHKSAKVFFIHSSTESIVSFPFLLHFPFHDYLHFQWSFNDILYDPLTTSSGFQTQISVLASMATECSLHAIEHARPFTCFASFNSKTSGCTNQVWKQQRNTAPDHLCSTQPEVFTVNLINPNNGTLCKINVPRSSKTVSIL